jgi:hypothetical protein
MDIFYPFIYKQKVKKEFEPLPLYIESIPPELEEIKQPSDEDVEEKESNIIIIDLL